MLGKSFTPAALAAVSGVTVDGLRDPLGVLVRREVLTVTSDPRSPERGQYEFVQDLLRKVAYETLSRHDRKAKHLAVAAYLQSEGENDEDDVVEVIASHYVDALRSDPDAADAPQTRGRARDMLVRAGDRAVMLAAPAEALRYFTQALDFTDDVLGRAKLDERAGQAAAIAGRFPETRAHMDRAIAAFESQGQVHAAARVSARLAEVDFYEDSLTAAITRMQAALAVLSSDPVDADIAEVSRSAGAPAVLRRPVDRGAAAPGDRAWPPRSGWPCRRRWPRRSTPRAWCCLQPDARPSRTPCWRRR